MDAKFWHKRWETNDIAFHQSEANPLLVNHFSELSLPNNSRLFIPLCGKTLDIAWLLSNGHHVVGIDLSEMAIKHLFAALKIEPNISKLGNLKLYQAPSIDIFVGDFFELSSSYLESIDAIYDRAALVALPKDLRIKYVAHLIKITNTAPQLLINYNYEPNLLKGPPFSISDEEIHQHYKALYQIKLLSSTTLPEGLRGKSPVKENLWHLSNGEI